MYHIAIYARYSTADQSPTSIEDQIRRCRKTIETKGIDVVREIVFEDHAASGSDRAVGKRKGYLDLIEAIEKREVTCLVADELSRLGRDPSELLRLKDLLEKYRILLLTVDGLDSRSPDWGLKMSFLALMSKAELDNVRHMTKRGMHGQLERGYMIAAPAFGYMGVRVTAAGKPVQLEDEAAGTIWEIVEAKASIVRQIYTDRAAGKSLAAIAKDLNARGVLPPRPRKNSAWLASTVAQLLRNPVYRGVFIYQGSPAYLSHAKKSGQSSARAATEYNRPNLRLVSDETWQKCNKESSRILTNSPSAHLLKGMVQCGACGGTLSVTSASHKSRSLYCPTCEANRAAGAKKGNQTTSVGVDGILVLLQRMLRDVLNEPEIFSTYHDTLRARLTFGGRQRLAEMRKDYLAQERTYRQFLDQFLAGDERLKEKVQLLAEKYKSQKLEYEKIKHQLRRLDEGEIIRRLSIPPEKVIEELVGTAGKDFHRLTPILRNLFPSIRLLGRSPNKAAIFEIQLDLDLAVSSATKTKPAGERLISRCYCVWASKSRPTVWSVTTYPPE